MIGLFKTAVAAVAAFAALGTANLFAQQGRYPSTGIYLGTPVAAVGVGTGIPGAGCVGGTCTIGNRQGYLSVPYTSQGFQSYVSPRPVAPSAACPNGFCGTTTTAASSQTICGPNGCYQTQVSNCPGGVCPAPQYGQMGYGGNWLTRPMMPQRVLRPAVRSNYGVSTRSHLRVQPTGYVGGSVAPYYP